MHRARKKKKTRRRNARREYDPAGGVSQRRGRGLLADPAGRAPGGDITISREARELFQLRKKILRRIIRDGPWPGRSASGNELPRRRENSVASRTLGVAKVKIKKNE